MLDGDAGLRKGKSSIDTVLGFLKKGSEIVMKPFSQKDSSAFEDVDDDTDVPYLWPAIPVFQVVSTVQRVCRWVALI